MTTLTPYLLFDGTCQKAMEFYKVCIGGELALTKVKDSPAKDHMPAFQQGEDPERPSQKRQYRDFGIRLAHARTNASPRQHGLSLSERRNPRRIEGPV